MKNIGILIKNFLFENYVLLFIVSKYFIIINFIISILYLIKTNKKIFFKKVKRIYKFFFILIVSLFILNLINRISFLNHVKFISLIFLLLISISIALYFSKNHKIFKNCLSILNIINLIIIFDIFLYKFVSYSLITNWYNFINVELRYSSIFFDEKILGFYLLSTMPLILLYKNRYSQKLNDNEILFLIIIMLYVFAIYFTGERRSFLLSLLSFVLIIYDTRIWENFNKKVLISLILILFLFLISIFSSIKSKNEIKQAGLNFRMVNLTIKTVKSIPLFFENKNEYHNYIQQNDIGNWFLLYDSSINLYNQNLKTIIFGIGYKNYKEDCSKQKNLICSTHPHHYFIELLLSFGLIGFLLIMFYFYKIFKKLFKTKKKSYEFIIFLIIFFFPLLPTGSIISVNLLGSCFLISTLFIANHFIIEDQNAKHF